MLLFLICCSCAGTGAKEENAQMARGEVTATKVATVRAKILPFDYLVDVSGRVQSLTDVQIQSKVAGLLTAIKVSNGSVVSRGEILAELNNDKQKLAFERAYVQLQEKRVSFNDLAIGYLNNADSLKFKNALENVKITSGLTAAEIAYKEAKIEFENTQIRATVSGVVSDLDLKQGNPIDANRLFCRVHNPGNLVVVAHVLETDALKLRVGSKAEVKTLSEVNETVKGTVIEINPRVDEKSNLVRLVAKLQNNKDLLPGMSVQLTLIIPYSKNIVVPKEAVVIRSGKHVVFTAEDGLAKWNYVTVGMENGKEIEILQGLRENQVVIITNNLQLAHDAPIKVQ